MDRATDDLVDSHSHNSAPTRSPPMPSAASTAPTFAGGACA
jgi:hypothetical protein